MDKIRTILVIMLFFGAALAGCTGEEIEQVVEDNTENDNTNNTADTNDTADDTNNTVDEPDTAVYAATDILAMLGVDGSDDAELDFMAPADGQEKFGIVMVINAPMDSLGLTDDEGSPSSGGGEDVEIVITNMFDNTTKRVASHMMMTMNMGGMSMQIHMKDTQGQHPEFSNIGYINQVMTNMETYQPEATWLIDNDWSYEQALEEIMPMDDDECNGNGYMMDSMGEMGPHCMCDEGYDWDEEDMMTCVSSEDGDMGDECPFDADNDLSPCNAVECEDHDSDECMQYVVNYCEEHPDDGACVVHNDSDPAFICGDGSEVPFEYVNDGDQDCPDGADEQQYNDDGTKLNWFDCHDGTQIWIDQVNDGVEDCAHGEDEAGDHDDGTGASSADGRHCVPEGEVCPEDGGDHDHGVEDGNDDYEDDDMLVTLDGVVLGESTFEWIWMDGLVGPVDGSDGMPVTVISGQVWELNLEDWKTTDMHVVELSSTNADKPLVSQCNEDGLRGHGDVGHGVFAVYDSWAWSPEEPELEGDGWLVEADGEYGWNAPFNCADQGELQTLTVTFSKTLKDYNAGNLEAEEAGVDGYDWEQDVEDNQAPTCHVFASTTNDGTNWEESEDHFEAPDGDYTIELTPGVWFLSVYCKDPDGDMVMGQVTANGEVFEFLEEEEGHAFAEFPVMAGMPNLTVEYKWDSTGGHSGSGTITLVVEIIEDSTVDEIVEPITNDDGTLTCPDNLVLSDDQTQCVAPSVDNVGDIIEEVAADEGGSIPGFTTALSVISMLGAVLVMSRRKEDC